MGRQVMKGEKGITIIAPAPYKKMKEKEVLDENHSTWNNRIHCQEEKSKTGKHYKGSAKG